MSYFLCLTAWHLTLDCNVIFKRKNSQSVTVNKTNCLIAVNLAETGYGIDNAITQLLSITQLLRYIFPILLEKVASPGYMSIFCLVFFFISCFTFNIFNASLSLIRLALLKVGNSLAPTWYFKKNLYNINVFL